MFASGLRAGPPAGNGWPGVGPGLAVGAEEGGPPVGVGCGGTSAADGPCGLPPVLVAATQMPVPRTPAMTTAIRPRTARGTPNSVQDIVVRQLRSVRSTAGCWPSGQHRLTVAGTSRLRMTLQLGLPSVACRKQLSA